MRLEERNGLFFAKCVLHATPDMEIWGWWIPDPSLPFSRHPSVSAQG